MKRAVLFVGFVLMLVAPLAACGVGAAGGSPKEVKVTLTDFAIHSSVTTFTTGTSYHFIVTNSGQALHELMVVPSSTGQGSEDEIDAARLFEVEDIDPGETKTIDYTFKDKASPGVLEFACHQPGHYEAGMHLDITVD